MPRLIPKSIYILFAMLLLVALAATTFVHAKTQPPNVVLIMVDDLGYRDLGSYGHLKIKTPVLDNLAKEGIKLTSFYSGATVCTPSRMALLTGAYPPRLGWTKGVMGYKIPSHSGMSSKALTIAEVFKTKGYATGISGKWHLGATPDTLPQGQGFDSAYYITMSNNQTKKLWRDGKLLENPFNNRLLTEQFTNAAIGFIKAQKGKPFFLYMPYTAPHFPVQAHPDWKGKSNFGAYGDVVEELDSRIGEMLATLKEEGIEKNTIVVFLSDNGPQSNQQARATPYRGWKWDALEGGTRVPCIIRYPGVIPAGTQSNKIIAAIDLLPTLSSACGIDLKTISNDSPKIDGLNVLDTLTAKQSSPHARKDLLYWHGMNGFHAIRVGNWKLFFKGKDTQLKGMTDKPVLFNLADEVDEMTDLSAKYPEKVKAMQALASKQLADIAKNIVPLRSKPKPSSP